MVTYTIPKNSFNIEGIVLKTFASGESDLILRTISSSRGKLSLLAKHARKSKQRFGTLFDIFDRGNFQVQPGRNGLYLVNSFIPLRPFQLIRRDLDCIVLASILCECADLLVAEDQSDGNDSYRIVSLGLEALESAPTLKERFKGTFLAVSGLLVLGGVLDQTRPLAPSLKNFSTILDCVENFAERKLVSRTALDTISKTLRKEAPSGQQSSEQQPPEVQPSEQQ